MSIRYPKSKFNNRTLGCIMEILSRRTDSQLRTFFFKFGLSNIYTKSGDLTSKLRKVTDVFDYLSTNHYCSRLDEIVAATLRSLYTPAQAAMLEVWETFPQDFPELESALRSDGYQVRDGDIVPLFPSTVEENIKEVQLLLQRPEFRGADEQFKKALGHLNASKPDYENCIKDAISSIESVARIIVNDKKPLLDKIVEDLARRKFIPRPLDQVFQKLYAYRGNEPGVAHGLVGDSKVNVDEAEFVLGVSAAAILYLSKKKDKI